MGGGETKEEKSKKRLRKKQEKKDRKKEKRKKENQQEGEAEAEAKKKAKKKKRLRGTTDDDGDVDAAAGAGGDAGDAKKKKKKRKLPHNGREQQQQQQQQQQQLVESAAAEGSAEMGGAQAAATSGSSSSREGEGEGGPGPFRLTKIRTVVSLSPSSLSDVRGNIRRLSCEAITRFATGLGGVLMAVRDVRLCDGEGRGRSGGGDGGGGFGRVLNELPHVHFNVEADVVVFSPEVAMKLTGEVNESFPSHVGMLVNTLFNAMVPAEHLRKAGYNFDPDLHEWTRERSGRGERLETPVAINVGDAVTFTVQKMHECNGIISLEGFEPSVLP